MINSIPDDVLMLFYAEKITPDLWGNDAVYRIGDVEVAGWLFDKYIIEFTCSIRVRKCLYTLHHTSICVNYDHHINICHINKSPLRYQFHVQL